MIHSPDHEDEVTRARNSVAEFDPMGFELLVTLHERGPADPRVTDLLDSAGESMIDRDLPDRFQLLHRPTHPSSENAYIRFRTAFMVFGSPDVDTLVHLADAGHYLSALAVIQIGTRALQDPVRYWSGLRSGSYREMILENRALPSEEKMTAYTEHVARRGRGDGFYYLSLRKERRSIDETLLLKRASDLGHRPASWALYQLFTERGRTEGLAPEEDRERLTYCLRSVLNKHRDPKSLTSGPTVEESNAIVDNVPAIVESLGRIGDLESELRALRTENDGLRTELLYRPGGDGYLSAEESFHTVMATATKN